MSALERRIYRLVPRSLRRTPLISDAARRWAGRREMRETDRLVEQVQPYSMVPAPTLRDLCAKARLVLDRQVPGAFVECGVWRGGSAFLMAKVLDSRDGNGRKVWLFDSFEGLPDPQEIDGPGAAAYSEDRDSPRYFDNCRAGLDEVVSNARALGIEHRTEMVPGWFHETLLATRDRVGPIALLRLDCDWHESVTVCLDALYDQVSRGGIVIIDDYYAWDGCAVAVHEFLGRRRLAHRLHEVAGVAFFRKD